MVVPPVHSDIIKFSMLFFCPLAHPTVVYKRSLNIKYPQIALEDYALWLSLKDKATFANIGDILLQLRKHPGNKSAQNTMGQEIQLKQKYLPAYLQSPGLINEICTNAPFVKDLIAITAREVRFASDFKVKNPKLIVKLFEEMSKAFEKDPKITDAAVRDYIVSNLDARKNELALHGVANDLDTEMLKCLLKGNGLRRLMKS